MKIKALALTTLMLCSCATANLPSIIQPEKKIFYIKSAHEDPFGSKEYEAEISQIKLEELDIIDMLHKNHGIDMLASEGLYSEVSGSDIESTIREASKAQRLAMILSLDAASLYELNHGDSIYTYGVSSKVLDRIGRDVIVMLAGMNRIKSVLPELENMPKEYALAQRLYEDLVIGLRSSYAAEMVLEKMKERNAKACILIYGGKHEETLRKAFEGNASFHVIEPPTYKKLEKLLESEKK